MAFLQVSDISYKIRGEEVLQHLDLVQEEGEKVAIAGETGSGKSTLLKIIAGLVQPFTGQIYFEEDRVKGPEEQLVAGHPGIAYLSQQFELPGFLRVEQVLQYANTLPQEEADQVFRLCQIEHLLLRRTDELSGGERQRIALARLLLTSPRLLLLDEPFSNLDMAHKAQLKTVLHDLGSALGISFLLVSHDPLDTLSWADRILVLRQGQLQQQGTPEEIYRQPVNEYTASLFGPYNLFSIEQTRQMVPQTDLDVTKQALVRPENLWLQDPEQAIGLLAEVRQVSFMGSYYETEVVAEGKKYLAKASSKIFTPGALVRLGIKPQGIWFV